MTIRSKISQQVQQEMEMVDKSIQLPHIDRERYVREPDKKRSTSQLNKTLMDESGNYRKFIETRSRFKELNATSESVER